MNRRVASLKRNYRSSRCRACAAFQARITRQRDPERFKDRDRARRAQYVAGLTPEQRQQDRNGDPVAGDLEFEVGVGAAVGRTGWDRWNVEHTFTGLDNFRRLVVRYGRQHMPASSLP